MLSIIIPTYNDTHNLLNLLSALQPHRSPTTEIIVVDGESAHFNANQLQPFADILLQCPKGRARQMNTAAQYASGQWLLFLHADTQLPDNFSHALTKIIQPDTSWGFFSIKLSGRHTAFRLIEYCINRRSKWTKIATGDQGLFVSAMLFNHANGYPDWNLMEDIALTKKLRRHSKPLMIKTHLITSSRRWEQHGILKTILLMWWLRLLFFCKVHPNKLAKYYTQ